MTFVVLGQTTPSDTSALSTVLVEGLSLGTIYALLAVGFVIIFKSTQVLNFAHGALAALGAFLVSASATTLDIPGRWIPNAPAWVTWAGAVVIAMVFMALIGAVVERVFLRPMVGEELFAVAIITLGIDIVVRTITNDFIGQFPRPMGDPLGIAVLDLGWVRIAHTTVLQVAVALVAVGGIALFFRSRMGIAMRATAFDQETARAQGINVGRVFSLAWAIGAGLAAIAGLFASLYPRRASGVDQASAFLAFKAFPAIIIGGLDSVVGAIVGGLIVGFAEAAATIFLGQSVLGSGFPGIVPYLLMLVVLVVRPFGLFGTEEIRRV
ncbi:MAG: branched-chain amino acid ABC transporter permease [Actinobacteria bacterium]|nr:branched-chain amino acid ABC transporter permease [Actinomycetota bacterium]MCI0543378.1 branched-chain amino acid ABC transporter permease [Actinomycetota bacterium]MCI0678687.1 branched-chain amino acid ABC transporter permease [Actinomycetota bacterium]